LPSSIRKIAGIDLELFEDGAGAPLLLLHPGRGFVAGDAHVGMLAGKRRLIAPSHPGFGKSSLPMWLDHPADIAHVYLELLDALGLEQVDVIGGSIGGWIAAEMAAMAPERFGKIVLVGPVGVKVGPPDKLDMPDVFALRPEKLPELLFHDPGKRRDPATMSDDELAVTVRNWETLALLAWEPYMHNPKLRHRLHRVTNPVLFLRGASDRLISADYVAKYAALLPNARVETIAAAGHVPESEQPEAFVSKVLAFLESRS
jgi:pimeloyl-ACP methyl ester carboxylesterase